MGRKSALTEKQWTAIEQRMLGGEGVRALGREFGISEAAIRKRLGAQVESTKAIANQIVSTECALMNLPISAQINAQNLAAKLRNISSNLASAADLGASTAHRLQALANSEVNKVDDAEPFGSIDSLRNVGLLTRLANDSASIALNLLAANKETVAKINSTEEDVKAEPLRPQLARDAWELKHGHT